MLRPHSCFNQLSVWQQINAWLLRFLTSISSVRKVITLYLVYTLSLIPVDTWASAQFSSISSRQGLSDNNINAIVQDHRGLLWIATEAGLNRFDGHSIETYTHGKYPDALPDDEIVTMELTADNKLWLGTESGGLILFDIDRLKFTRIGAPGTSSSRLDGKQLSSDTVHALVQVKGNRLFIGTEGGGLNVYDIESQSVAYYFVDRKQAHSLCHNEVKVMHKARDGTIWLGTVDGLNRLDPASMAFHCFRNEADNEFSLSNNEVVAIQEDDSGNLWVGTEGGGVNYFDSSDSKFYRYQQDANDPASLSNDEIQTLYISEDESLWVGTVNGLNRLAPDQANLRQGAVNFEKFWYQKGSRDSISSNVISAIYQDHGGVIWVGTEGGGLNKLIPASFSRAARTGLSDELWSGHRISAIYKDVRDVIWVGSENLGLFSYHPGTQEYLKYDCRQLPCEGNMHLEVTAIAGNDERVWFATDGGGLIKFSLETSEFYAIPLPDIEDLAITSLHLTPTGELWMGTEQSLVLNREPNTGQLQAYPLTPLINLDAEFGNEVQSLLLDSRNNLWIGTEEYGVVLFNLTQNKMTLLNKQSKPTPGLSSNSINSIVEDGAGRVWLATNLGVNIYEPESNRFRQIYVEDGLLSNTVMSAVVDELGDIWLATNRGINRVQSRSRVISSYDHSDGLVSDYYGRQAVFKSKEGHLYFGGNNGIDIINPEAVTKNLHQPKLAITRLKLFDLEQSAEKSEVLTKPIYATERLTLSHNQAVFSLEFSTLDFTAPEKSQYAYYLEGFDPRWQYVGNQRLAAYTNLPAGKYVFNVKGTNNDGVWSQPVQLEIVITAAPWKSPWAYGLYFLLGLLAVYLVLSFKLRRQRAAFELQREREEKQRLEENFAMEQRFTANVAHELRTPLAELINMSEVALMWPDAPEIKESFYQDVLDSATQMHQVVNNLLALARCERGLLTLKLEPVDLVHEVKHTWERHQNLWHKKSITLALSGDEDWEIVSHQAELALILNNIISNGIEYSPQDAVIHIHMLKSQNLISIRNRMEVPLSQQELKLMFQRLWRKEESRPCEQHSGLGMPLIKAYAEILNLSVGVETRDEDFILTLSNFSKA